MQRATSKLTIGNLLHPGGVNDERIRVTTLYVRPVLVLLLEHEEVVHVQLLHQVERLLLLVVSGDAILV